MPKRRKSLRDWIDEIGVNKVAQAFCLERSTIRKWRDGSQLPKALHMHAIVKASKGQVTYETMIDPWVKKNPVTSVLGAYLR